MRDDLQAEYGERFLGVFERIADALERIANQKTKTVGDMSVTEEHAWATEPQTGIKRWVPKSQTFIDGGGVVRPLD